MTERTCAAADLARALKGCSPGDTLTVDGDVTRAKLSGLAFDGAGVVVHGRFVGYTTFAGCSGITLSGELVETAGTMMLGVSQSERFRLEGVAVRGEAVDADGYFKGTGVKFTDCGPGCEIVKSEFARLGNAIGVLRGDGLLIQANAIHDIKTDGVDLYDASGVAILDNDFFDFFPAPADHPDAVQFTYQGSGRSSERITVVGNRVRVGRGRPIQGFQLKGTPDYPLKQVVVRLNSTFGTMFIGANAENCAGVTIEDNFFQGWETNLFKGAPMGSFLYIRGSTDVQTANNVANPAIPLAKDASDTAELDKWMAAHAPAPEPEPAPAPDPRDAQIAALNAQVAALGAQLADAKAQIDADAKALAEMTAARDEASAEAAKLEATLDAVRAALAA